MEQVDFIKKFGTSAILLSKDQIPYLTALNGVKAENFSAASKTSPLIRNY